MATNNLGNKSVTIYIDDTAAVDALQRLQKNADGFNKKIDEGRKKQQELTDAIAKAKEAGEGYSKLEKDLKKVNTELTKSEKDLSKVNDQLGNVQKQLDGKLGSSLTQQRNYVKRLTEEWKHLAQGTEEEKKKLEELGEASKVLDQMKKRLADVSKVQEEVTKPSASGSGFISSFFGNLAANTVSNVTSLIQNAISQGIAWAKEVGGVENAFNKLNNPGLLNELRKATRGTVADLDLMKAAVKADNFKIPLEQLGTLFKFAQQRARDTGESVDYLTESIVLGISRKSIPIMDNLGISATALQKEVQKTGDFAKAAFNIVNAELAKAGPYIETGADKLDRWKVGFQNIATSAGKFVLSLIEGQKTANQLFDEAQKETENYDKTLGTLLTRYDQLKGQTNLNKKEQAELQGIINKIVEIVPQAATEINKYGNALDINKEKVKGFLKEQGEFLKLRNKDAIEEQTKEAQRYAQNIEREAAKLQKGKKIVRVNGTEFEADLTAEDRQNLQSSIAQMQESLISTADLLKEKFQTEVPNSIKKTVDAARLAKYGADQVNALLAPLKEPSGPSAEELQKQEEEAKKRAEEAKRKREQEAQRILNDQKKLAEDLEKAALSIIPDGLYKELLELEKTYADWRDLAHGNQELLLKAEEQYLLKRKDLIHKYAQIAAQAESQRSREQQEAFEKQIKELPKRIEALSKSTIAFAKNQLKDVDQALEAGQARQSRDKLAGLEVQLLKAHGRKRLDAELEILNEQERQELSKKDLTENEKLLIEAQYQQKRQQAEIDHYTKLANTVLSYAQQVLNIFNMFDQARAAKENAELASLQKKTDKEKTAHKRLLDNKLVSQQEYNKRTAASEEALEKKRHEIEVKQFKRKQRAQYIQALMNNAEAVTKTLSEFGPPVPPNFLGIAAMAFTVGSGIANLIAISKQKPPEYAKGGYLNGPSHSAGGMPVINPRTGRKEAEVEGGEVILSKKTVQNNAPLVNQLLQSSMYRNGAPILPWFKTRTYQSIDYDGLNRSAKRVRFFEKGGVLPSSSAGNSPAQQPIVVPAMTEQQELLMQALLQRLQEPPKAYVVYSEIQAAGDKLDQIKADATFRKN